MSSPHEVHRESLPPYQPLSPDPDARETEPLTGHPSDAPHDVLGGMMGNEEQMFVKPEARPGDRTAFIAATVSRGRSSGGRYTYYLSVRLVGLRWSMSLCERTVCFAGTHRAPAC